MAAAVAADACATCILVLVLGLPFIIRGKKGRSNSLRPNNDYVICIALPPALNSSLLILVCIESGERVVNRHSKFPRSGLLRIEKIPPSALHRPLVVFFSYPYFGFSIVVFFSAKTDTPDG